MSQMDFRQLNERLASRLDVGQRQDIAVLTCKRIGSHAASHHIASVRLYYTASTPTRAQIQNAVNRIYGQLAVIEPREIHYGRNSISLKVFSKAPLSEQDGPTGAFMTGMHAAITEPVPNRLIEQGDMVRVYCGMVETGEVAAVDVAQVTVVLNGKPSKVDRDAIVHVASSSFTPMDTVAFEYFRQIYPDDFARAMSTNDVNFFKK